MIHSYKITGMTCASCQATVKKTLEDVEGVTAVAVDLQKGEARITMEKHIDDTVFEDALKPYPKYKLVREQHAPQAPEAEAKTWWESYKPVLLIFAYITGVTLLIEVAHPAFDWMRWMTHFMAGFFLAFSFFKLLDLQGFADSYSTYDIIARRWRGYAYCYAFIELALGLAFVAGFFPVLTNAVTLLVMGISLVGVLQAVLGGNKIRCACLGSVFNLPMSSITIIEDVLMIVMAALMLIVLA